MVDVGPVVLKEVICRAGVAAAALLPNRPKRKPTARVTPLSNAERLATSHLQGNWLSGDQPATGSPDQESAPERRLALGRLR